MRVVFLTPGCFDKGGISRYCRYQIEALREFIGPKQIEVLSLLGPDENDFETPFHVDWHGGRAGELNKLKFSAASMLMILRSRPDVIHVAHVNLAPLAIKLARLVNARTILNVYALELWSGLTRSRREALFRMTRVLADCHYTADFVIRSGLHAQRPDVIWDCVDLDRFSPGECPLEVRKKYNLPNKNEHFVIMTLGRLARAASHKGYDRLIEAFSRVQREIPHSRLVIAGRGDDLERLEQLVSQFALQRSVIFTGAIDECDLADCYRSASLFSLVSDRGHGRGEGIPLTPLEAMGCGVPIVVGNQDGSQEAVLKQDGQLSNGFVIDPYDIESHARIIVQLAKNKEMLAHLQHNARKIAAENFGYRRFVNQNRELYESLTIDT